MTSRRPRIAYLSGPVDGHEILDHVDRIETLDYLGTSYLADWYRVCERLDAEGLVVTTLPRPMPDVTRGRFRLFNRPTPNGSSGLRYHVQMAWWTLARIRELMRFKPDVVIITAGSEHGFLFHLLKLRRGVRIIAAEHCVIWRPFRELSRGERTLLRVKRFYYRNTIDAALVASERIGSQLRELRGDSPLPMDVFLPLYSESRFADAREPLPRSPGDAFGVFYAGRIEENKGVFDLVEIAQSLETRSPGRFVFHMCGDGGRLEHLRSEIARRGLSSVVLTHGFCSGEEMASIIDGCHVTIVPTRSSFGEGFNMVCAESVLFHRPVITSAVCPAIDYIPGSVYEVPPDDVEGYTNALVTLEANEDEYEALVRRCDVERRQFLIPGRSYGALLEPLLTMTTGVASSTGRPMSSAPAHTGSR